MYKFELNDPLFLPHSGCSFTFSLEEGEGILLLGHNGIGKTTLARRIFAMRSEEIVYIEQSPVDLFFDRTLGEVKRILLNGRKHLLESEKFHLYWKLFGLDDKEDRLLSHLSGGENQALKLIFGLVRKSSFYILDEPGQSLDSEKKNILASILKELRLEGKMLFIIEHDFSWLNEGWQVMTLEQQDGMLLKGKSWTI